MIRVNLLPFELRPVRRSPVPYILSALVLVLALLTMATVFLGGQARIAAANRLLAQHEKELSDLSDIVDKSERLTSLKEGLKDKIDTIQEIVSERIIWSRQLWNVSRLTPENFWYSRIRETSKQFREQRLVYNEKTKKEEMKTVTLKKSVLELQGYVIEGPDGTNDIYPLTLETEQDTEFSSMFQLSQPKLVDTEFEGYSVRSFTLEYLILFGEDKS